VLRSLRFISEFLHRINNASLYSLQYWGVYFNAIQLFVLVITFFTDKLFEGRHVSYFFNLSKGY